MAQYLLLNPEELSLYPKPPHQKPGMVKHTESPTAGLKEPESSLAVAPASVRSPASKKIR